MANQLDEPNYLELTTFEEKRAYLLGYGDGYSKAIETAKEIVKETLKPVKREAN